MHPVISAPGPTWIMPADEAVRVTVSRNTITMDPKITTTFKGGDGAGHGRARGRHRNPDGWDRGKRNNPQIGTTVTLKGDAGTGLTG